MLLSTVRSPRNLAPSRRFVYVATFAVLFLAGLFLHRSAWTGTAQLHTLMEAQATLIAITVGMLALVRFYSQKENIFLFIGTGFIGTGLLDGYHALVSAPAFTDYFPSPPPSLIPWSGLAGRMFLSVLLCLSWAFWPRESRKGTSARIPEYRVYFIVNTWTLMCFLFFAIVPLPSAYWSLPFLHRPQEFLPAAFCLVALRGYLRKGSWKHDAFEHCLVLTIILFTVHLLYMSSSAKLYDMPYMVSHLLRLAAYLSTLAGVIVALYQLLREQRILLEARGEDLRREIALRRAADEALRLARAGHSGLPQPSRVF
jgi:hypothetical protein